MFWLIVDMRLHFHFAASDLFLIGIPITYVQVRQNGMPKIKQMQVKLNWSVCVKACFIFLEIVKN